MKADHKLEFSLPFILSASNTSINMFTFSVWIERGQTRWELFLLLFVFVFSWLALLKIVWSVEVFLNFAVCMS